MTVPTAILNRLREGKDLAARVAPQQPGHLAWVYVDPFLDPNEALWLRGRLYRTGSGNPIRGYLVRYVEAEPEVVEKFRRYDQDDLSRTVVDVIQEVSTEEELAQVLSRWLSDFTALRDLRAAEYWFASGPQLVWPRIIEERERNCNYRENDLQPEILAEQRIVAALPRDSIEGEEHRRQIKRLADRWRRSVRVEAPWEGGMSFATAARHLEIHEDGLMRLIDWGLLTVCDLPEHARVDGKPLVLLEGEIDRLLDGETTMEDEPLPREAVWWRGLVDLEP